jgi:uncharacterized protein YndB with AHSA1/START domain
LVFKAWTDPDMVAAWWGPEHFTAPVCKIDLRIGGKYLFCMRGPDGKDYWGGGVYKEIVPPERLVYTDSFTDAEGNIVDGEYYGMPGLPLEMLVTLTFEDVGGKTKMTLRHAGIPAGEDSEMASLGWSTSFDKLAASLK